MGTGKCALPFGPETMLERVARLVGQLTGDVVLAAAPDQQVPDRFAVSRDPAAGEGPLPGLLRAAAVLPTERVFVAACDVPLLQPALVTLLSDLSAGWDGAVPRLDGRRVPTCAVYQRSALLDARSRFGEPRHRSLHDYVSLLRIRDVDEHTLRAADADLISFLPCNTPEEYRTLLRMAGLPVNGTSMPAV
jgi:molybdopterin-guanine dinucleotide biosynthesis protein A